jgi:CRISPR-associated protein Cmr2
MSQYLFLFTISPVQSFIAQARKTQDLYAGSLLLSDLMKIATDHFCKQGGTVIYPEKNSNKLPNRFLGKIDTVENVKDIENIVKKEFVTIAYQEVRKKRIGVPKNFKRQILNHLDIHWVALPIEPNYEETFNKLQGLLGAVKNLRAFTQQDEKGRKCNLDGERNALFFGKGTEQSYLDLNEIKNITHGLEKNEGLSAVSFVKRFYEKAQKDRFLSTCEIAMLDLLEALKHTSAQSHIRILQETANPQCLYEENIRDKPLNKLLESEGKTATVTIVKDAQKAIANKVAELNKNRLPQDELKFMKYYGILVFDGDSMGSWVSGEHLKEEYKNKLEEFQGVLSATLSKFSTYIGEYKDNPTQELYFSKYCTYGRPVYSGGDDFLGFININHLFEVLEGLRTEFDKRVNQNPELRKYIKAEENLNFSAGVCIAHYKTPLNEVLQTARAMEKKAKAVEGKNAFAIAVMKHSGEQHQADLQWYKNGNETITISYLSSIYNELKAENFSNTFIKNLNTEFDKLDFGDNNNTELMKKSSLISKMCEAEIDRLVDRSCMLKNTEGLSTETFKELNQEKIKRMQDTVKILYDLARKPNYEANNFLHWLNIIDFMHRKA